jgi:hypothetical protein
LISATRPKGITKAFVNAHLDIHIIGFKLGMSMHSPMDVKSGTLKRRSIRGADDRSDNCPEFLNPTIALDRRPTFTLLSSNDAWRGAASAYLGGVAFSRIMVGRVRQAGCPNAICESAIFFGSTA